MDLNPESATLESIKNRYEDLKLFYSSDLVRQEGFFSEQELINLQEILEEAYAVLGNQVLREIYDEKLTNQLHQTQNSSPYQSTLTIQNLSSIQSPSLVTQSSSSVENPSQEETAPLNLSSLSPSSQKDTNSSSSNSNSSPSPYPSSLQPSSSLGQGQGLVTRIPDSLSPSENEGSTPGAFRLKDSARISNRALWKPVYDTQSETEDWIASNSFWDGESLKKVREYKNVTISQLSQVTKINSFYLTAIEDLDPQNLPAPVFVRGYVIQISRALGLSEQKVATSYMSSYQHRSENKKDLLF
jgi:hypothetical protein